MGPTTNNFIRFNILATSVTRDTELHGLFSDLSLLKMPEAWLYSLQQKQIKVQVKTKE